MCKFILRAIAKCRYFSKGIYVGHLTPCEILALVEICHVIPENKNFENGRYWEAEYKILKEYKATGISTSRYFYFDPNGLKMKE